MTTHCTYCGDSVPDDDYETHLRRTHADELTGIDERRVGAPSDEPKRRNLALYAGAGVILVVFVLGYSLVFLGSGADASSAAVQPDATAQIHEHGLITVQYDDTAVEFTEPRYIEADDCFHFHGNDAQVWHAHCEDVTIEYALETLGMDVTADTFTVDGQTFAEADGDEVSVTVDGEEVDPQEYVLEGVESVDDAGDGAGDTVEIVVRSGD